MAQFIVFTCERCGRAREAPLERGDEETWDSRGARICGECLDQMCGLVEGGRRPGESAD